MNPFSVGDIVSTITGSRTIGIVKYIACNLATVGGGKTCERDKCQHNVKDFCWIVWQDKKMYSYRHDELVKESSLAEIKPDKVVNVSGADTDVLADTVKICNDQPKIDWKLYNGFSSVRRDRSGRKFILEAQEEKPPIQYKDIDWKKYNGFEK